jgi:hypothetical protein
VWLHNVVLHNAATQCAHTVWLQCDFSVATQCGHSVATVWLQCGYTVWLQCGYTMWLHSVATRCDYTVWLHSVATQCGYTVCPHSVATVWLQCDYTVWLPVTMVSRHPLSMLRSWRQGHLFVKIEYKTFSFPTTMFGDRHLFDKKERSWKTIAKLIIDC